MPENKDEFDFLRYDYVIDAVDTVTAKIAIIEEAKKAGVPIISSMGAGNKLDPTGNGNGINGYSLGRRSRQSRRMKRIGNISEHILFLTFSLKQEAKLLGMIH